MRGALAETQSGHWLTKKTRVRVVRPELMYVKTNPGEHFTQDQITAMALAPLQVPVYDNAERRMFWGLVTGYGVDSGSTAVCLALKHGAHEAGPIAASAPIAGALILVGHAALVRYDMGRSPLYFSNSNRTQFGEKMVDFNAVEHGAIGLRNLFKCGVL
jgi:hypothetical protein